MYPFFVYGFWAAGLASLVPAAPVAEPNLAAVPSSVVAPTAPVCHPTFSPITTPLPSQPPVPTHRATTYSGSVYTRTVTYGPGWVMTLSDIPVPTSTVHTVGWGPWSATYTDGVVHKRVWPFDGKHPEPTVSVPAVSVPAVSVPAVSVNIGEITTSGSVTGVYTMPAGCTINKTDKVVPTPVSAPSPATTSDWLNIDVPAVPSVHVNPIPWIGPVGPVR